MARERLSPTADRIAAFTSCSNKGFEFSVNDHWSGGLKER
jgi:hypothetical protein